MKLGRFKIDLNKPTKTFKIYDNLEFLYNTEIKCDYDLKNYNQIEIVSFKDIKNIKKVENRLNKKYTFHNDKIGIYINYMYKIVMFYFKGSIK